MVNHVKFKEWAQKVYKNDSTEFSPTGKYFQKGDADPRSLFECLLEAADSSINEHLNSLDFDFNLIDSVIAEGIVESFNVENEEALNEISDFVKKKISKTIDGATDLMNKGIQIGADLYKSVEEINNKLSKAIGKVFEKVATFLKLTWEWAKKKSKKALEEVKNFVRKEAKGVAISSLASILSSKSAEAELEEAPKDINSAVSKISGKTYKLDPNKGAEELKDFTSELEDAKEEDIDDIVIADLAISESVVHSIFTSLKGLILEGVTLSEVYQFVHDELNENNHNKKGLIGWLIEAVGFALNPFAKLYEMAIKVGSNGLMITVSAIARGGVKNAYKYVVMGTIVSLTYHIIHGLTSIASHFGENGGEGEKIEIKNVKIGENKKLLDPEDALEALSTLGKVFLTATKFFLPQVTLVMEIVITSIASFELMIAFCESSSAAKDSAACRIITKVEHNLESAFS